MSLLSLASPFHYENNIRLNDSSQNCINKSPCIPNDRYIWNNAQIEKAAGPNIMAIGLSSDHSQTDKDGYIREHRNFSNLAIDEMQQSRQR